MGDQNKRVLRAKIVRRELQNYAENRHSPFIYCSLVGDIMEPLLVWFLFGVALLACVAIFEPLRWSRMSREERSQ